MPIEQTTTAFIVMFPVIPADWEGFAKMNTRLERCCICGPALLCDSEVTLG